MKRAVSFVLGATALLTSGCGTLRVQMAVLDPATLEQEKARYLVVSELPKVVASSQAEIHQQINDLANAHSAFYAALAKAYRHDAANQTDQGGKETLEALAEDLESGFTPEIKAEYETTRAFVIDVDERIRKTAEAHPSVGARRVDDQGHALRLSEAEWELAQLLRQRRHRLQKLALFVEEDTDGSVSSGLEEGADPFSRPEFKASRSELNAAIADVAETGALHQDPNAWAVASAPNEAWATQYNEVIARGYLGNLDVAVKVQSDRNFAIKGVAFDPSDVAAVASKAGTQALLIGAQLAGVPVTTQGTQAADPGHALVQSSIALDSAQRALLSVQNQETGYEDAMLAVADAVLAEHTRLTAGAQDHAARARAIAVVRQAFDAQKGRMEITGPCQGKPPAGGS